MLAAAAALAFTFPAFAAETGGCKSFAWSIATGVAATAVARAAPKVPLRASDGAPTGVGGVSARRVSEEGGAGDAAATVAAAAASG